LPDGHQQLLAKLWLLKVANRLSWAVVALFVSGRRRPLGFYLLHFFKNLFEKYLNIPKNTFY
jgi:hypothetical protein